VVPQRRERGSILLKILTLDRTVTGLADFLVWKLSRPDSIAFAAEGSDCAFVDSARCRMKALFHLSEG